MTLSRSMQASAAGLTAERFRLDTISGNLANANTSSQHVNGQLVRDAYRRQVVSLQATPTGPRIVRTLPDASPLREQFEPGNPFAGPDGRVFYPNVDPIKEMVDMMSASRAYEANLEAFNTARGMMRNALRIGQ